MSENSKGTSGQAAGATRTATALERLILSLLVALLAAPAVFFIFGFFELTDIHDSGAIGWCTTKVEAMRLAIEKYAELHDGAYPPDLNALRDARLLIGTFECPYHDRLARVWFRKLACIVIFIIVVVLAGLLGFTKSGKPAGGRVLLLYLAGCVVPLAFAFVEHRPSENVVHYVYAPPADGSSLPTLQDKPGNHGPYGLTVLTGSGVVRQPPQPTDPY